MDCDDKLSLVRKHALCALAYSQAADQLIAVSSLATRSEWDLAWEVTSRARVLCKNIPQSTAVEIQTETLPAELELRRAAHMACDPHRTAISGVGSQVLV